MDYKSIPYSPYEENNEDELVVGGKARVISAVVLGKTFPELKFAVNGGAKRQGEPTEAAMMKKNYFKGVKKKNELSCKKDSPRHLPY